MDTNYSEYEQPGVTVDLVVFTVSEDALKAMLIRRAETPYSGYWALPGGFITTRSAGDGFLLTGHFRLGAIGSDGRRRG